MTVDQSRPAEPPIFVVGSPRSGTSLLRNALRAHPRLTLPYETHCFPSYYRQYGDPRSDREAIRLAARILRTHWVSRWELPLQPEAFADCRSFAAMVTRFYREWARREDKPRWGDKTPQYVTEIPTLRAIFPTAQFIHIIRDGRDAARSWVKHPEGSGNLYAAASEWKRMVRTGRAAGASLPPDRYLEVRYETLLVEPQATLRRVCRFLREAFSEAMLQPHPLPEKYYPRLIGERRPLNPSWNRITPANAFKWKHNMSSADRALFESVAGDLLEELGYEVDGKTRLIPRLERMWWNAHNFSCRCTRVLNLREKHVWLAPRAHLWWLERLQHLRSAEDIAEPARPGSLPDH